MRHQLDRTVPVLIWHVALAQGWHLRYAEGMGTIHAISVVYRGMKVIQVNADLPVPYQRFAIAHELAHVLCDHVSLVQLCNGSAVDWLDRRQERQADLVVAHLLIPEWCLHVYEHPLAIATAADVPVEVVTLHLGVH